MKKNKITQVKSSTTIELISKPMNITNLKITPCIKKENLDTSHSKNEQVNTTFDVARKKDHEGNINIDSVIDQEKGCNINFMYCSNEEATGEKCATDNENLHDTCIDKNSPKKKNNIFTFNNDKYENLSERTDYKVPHLKILGRIETEFKFTSMFCINYIYMQIVSVLIIFILY